MDEYLRHRDIFTPLDAEHRDVDLVGAGALGGAILLALVKMGFGVLNRITLTDFDVCEMHNLSNQWFRRSHVLLGQGKVEALAEMVAWIGERDLVPVRARFTGGESRRVGPVVVLAIDSLEERARIWDRLRRRDDVRFVVDARMGAEVLEIHAVDPRTDDPAAYTRSLEVPEGETFEQPCTERAIFYTVLGGGAFVGSILRAWCRREPYPRHVVFDFRNFLLQT
jgi:molybdopterin/thiamine biosynthesis adenylyltransferase